MQKFNKLIIFLNGDKLDAGFLKSLIDDRTYLIGCDGGVDIIYGLGLKPHAVVGDFDSTQKIPGEIKRLKPKKAGTIKIIDKITYLKYPSDKDLTDGEVGLDFAVQKNFEEIVIVCGLGGDVDHEIGNFFMIGKAKYDGLNIKIINPKLEIFIVSGEVQINGQIGQKISLIPIFDKAVVAECSGLKYDLTKYRMAMETNTGTRNEFTSKTANLKIADGKFLAVMHK